MAIKDPHFAKGKIHVTCQNCLHFKKDYIAPEKKPENVGLCPVWCAIQFDDDTCGRFLDKANLKDWDEVSRELLDKPQINQLTLF